MLITTLVFMLELSNQSPALWLPLCLVLTLLVYRALPVKQVV
ncbi:MULTISPECIES: hypothetical protein [Eikenella]|nr:MULTISPECIES: hypothetical protein [Eikenella]